MDDKITQSFEDLDSSVKAAFTREYNKQHKDDFTGKKAPTKRGMKAAQAAAADDEDEDEADDGSGPALMTEDQKLEVKKGKKLEKEQEERAKVEKSDHFEILKLQENRGGATGKKRQSGVAAGKKGKKVAKKGKKGGKKGKSDDEDIDSDDSLNEFIVGDDDIEYDKKKKKSSGKRK